ncbi:MAG: hypothetical protein KTR24_09390 [Saprospiraceae bacterium]|nr:hypothetical protein [Saprospiraceae bacterium]
MKMLLRFLIMLTGLTLILQSCSEQEDPIPESLYGYEYFPLELGQSRTYQVDSIQFDIGSNGAPIQDSSRFYLREDFVEVFENQLGEQIYRIERYRAPDLDGPWVVWDVTTESRTVNQAFRTENNIRYINLVFPAKEGTRWDGNAFVDEDRIVLVRGSSLQMFRNWSYEITSSDVPEEIGPLTYPEVMTVQQAADTNLIEIRYSLEKYAKGVGRVYHEQWILDSFCKYTGMPEPCIGVPWRRKAGRGFIIRSVRVSP